MKRWVWTKVSLRQLSWWLSVVIGSGALGSATVGQEPPPTGQDKQPLTQQPLTQQPLTQQPLTQQPLTQQPLTQQAETQQAETQQAETQQSETQQSETQQSETQQSETQQSETQVPVESGLAVAAPAVPDPEMAGHGESTDALPGHSFHGEVFNEGPRQAAYLIPGTGEVHFPVSTNDPVAQQFFNQGIGQLHGFWYFEAERSFRQAAAMDGHCAMFYWGMAMANLKNPTRALKFIAQAKPHLDSASPREKMWVDALEKFCTAKDAEGKSIASDKRAQQYTRDLEEILFLDPTDIEVKAFLVGHLWENQRGQLATVSHVAVDALLEQVFAVSPRHPAHHYRIHLWDQRRPQQALASAALCGPSGPGIAHMWHMPGHIYAGLHRYHDAVWQMEASARVDHRQMTRDQVLPDQIHNYAHNNEWLIRNLLKVGRATEALALAENMLALPRHPAYNIGDKGSGRYGRQRSIATIASYRLWDELLSRADSIFGQTPEKDQLQWEKWQHVGIAAALAGQAETAAEMQVELAKILEQKLAEKEKTAPPAQESTIGDPDQVQKPAESGEPPSQLPAQTSAEEQASAAADRPVETKPVEAETADTKPVEAETADTKPVEAETADTKPVEAETADTKTRATAEQSPTEDAAKVAQAEPGAVAGEPVAAGQQPDEAASETPAANRNSQQRRRRSESPLDNDIETLRKASAGVEAAVAAAARDWETAVTRAEQASGIDGLLKAEWQAMAGQFSQARELSRREVEQRPNDVVPLAVDLYIAHQQWQADSIPGEAAAMDNASDADETVPTEPSDPETARQQLQRDFETLRRLAAQADLEKPLLSRLSRLAADCGYPGDWRLPLESQHDLGERPPLESLGPLHWSPYAAPNLMVFDSTGLEVQPWENREQAKLVMFYLGFGCLHCMEQLQKFSPEAERFAGAGIKLMAISCEPLNLLQQGLQNSEQTLKIPLHADPNLVGFKAFRCHDDFENQPLHGTFLIAPDGRVLWQDIGHEPFMDAEFVFLESKRLLELWSAKQSLWTSADAAD